MSKKPPTPTGPVRVEIPYKKFWSLARMQPVHMNISVFKALRDAGIPVDGGIELRGVTHGRLACWNDQDLDGDRICVYEWTPIAGQNAKTFEEKIEAPITPKAVIPDDDEL